MFKVKNLKVSVNDKQILKGFNIEHVYPMDHGCIWGEKLSAYRLADRTLISQESIEGN